VTSCGTRRNLLNRVAGTRFARSGLRVNLLELESVKTGVTEMEFQFEWPTGQLAQVVPPLPRHGQVKASAMDRIALPHRESWNRLMGRVEDLDPHTTRTRHSRSRVQVGLKVQIKLLARKGKGTSHNFAVWLVAGFIGEPDALKGDKSIAGSRRQSYCERRLVT